MADVFPDIREQFTIYPNSIFDELDRFLSPKQSKVLNHLWRLTHGYNKKSRQIGGGVIAERSGLCLKTVKTAIQELIDLGLVILVSRGGGKTANEYAICQFNKEDLDYIKSVNSENLESENEDKPKAKKGGKKGKSDPSKSDPSKVYPSKPYMGGSVNFTTEQGKPYMGGSVNFTTGQGKSYPSSVHKENLNKSTKEKEKERDEKVSLEKPPSGVEKDSPIQTKKPDSSQKAENDSFIENTIGLMNSLGGGMKKHPPLENPVQIEKTVQIERTAEVGVAGGLNLREPSETPLERIGGELEASQITVQSHDTMKFMSAIFRFCDEHGIQYQKNSKDSQRLWENDHLFREGILGVKDIVSRMKKHSDMKVFAREYPEYFKDKRFSEQFKNILGQAVSIATSLNGWGSIIDTVYDDYEKVILEISDEIIKSRKSKQLSAEIHAIRKEALNELNGEPKKTVIEVETNGNVQTVVEYEPYIPSKETLNYRQEKRSKYPGISDEQYDVVCSYLELNKKDDPRKKLYEKRYDEYMDIVMTARFS